MSIPPFVVLNKEIGQTPLEAITLWKNAHPEYRDIPATYAGRLDPMASGKLLVLLGDECRKREAYTGLDKEYEIEVALGISTDTGDALGMPVLASDLAAPDEQRMHEALYSVTDTHTVPYPAYSSKTVNGKPLFQYALEGTLDSISVPEHDETVYRIDFLNQKVRSASELRKLIGEKLRLVPRTDDSSKALGADFRQDAIRAAWEELLASVPQDSSFPIVRLRVICASGTYMRTLAERIGSALGTKGFALSIHRTKIGRFRRIGPLGFWSKKY